MKICSVNNYQINARTKIKPAFKGEVAQFIKKEAISSLREYFAPLRSTYNFFGKMVISTSSKLLKILKCGN